MSHVLFMIAACMLLFDSTAHAAGYKHGRIRPERDPATLYHNFQPVELLPQEQLARDFDWCVLNMCSASWNEHHPQYCGSCWAHGTLHAIMDRIKIRKQGQGPDVMLSRQTLLNCGAFYGFGNGCDGGDPIDVFHYMVKFGLPDESCMPYNATDHRKYEGLPDCPDIAKCKNCMPLHGNDTCWAVRKPVLYGLKSYGKLPNASDPLVMMNEIRQRGPSHAPWRHRPHLHLATAAASWLGAITRPPSTVWSSAAWRTPAAAQCASWHRQLTMVCGSCTALRTCFTSSAPSLVARFWFKRWLLVSHGWLCRDRHQGASGRC